MTEEDFSEFTTILKKSLISSGIIKGKLPLMKEIMLELSNLREHIEFDENY